MLKTRRVDRCSSYKSRRKAAPNTASTADRTDVRTSGISEIVWRDVALSRWRFAPYQNLRMNVNAFTDVDAAAHAADNPVLMVSDKIGLRMAA
jgi:hypothetical protein